MQAVINGVVVGAAAGAMACISSYYGALYGTLRAYRRSRKEAMERIMAHANTAEKININALYGKSATDIRFKSAYPDIFGEENNGA